MHEHWYLSQVGGSVSGAAAAGKGASGWRRRRGLGNSARARLTQQNGGLKGRRRCLPWLVTRRNGLQMRVRLRIAACTVTERHMHVPVTR